MNNHEIKESNKSKLLNIIFAIASFFIMFQTSEISSRFQFNTSQFIFLTPYIINYYFNEAETFKEIKSDLNKYGFRYYEYMDVLLAILALVVLLEITGSLQIQAGNILSSKMIFLSSISIPTWIISIFEGFSLLSLAIYYSLIVEAARKDLES